MTDWKKYIAYLQEWINAHKSEKYEGCSPVCYGEFLDNEAEED